MGKALSRAALAFPPTYEDIDSPASINHIEVGRDAYLQNSSLQRLARESGRYWSFHKTPTTVALPHNRYAKSLRSFTNHTTEPAFRNLLLEYSSFGCPRPSGYADVFHEIYQSPHVPWSINSQLAPCFAGGWQAAIKPGVHFGTFYKYDMRSAYLWAGSLGLPDTRTYTRSLRIGDGGLDGVYRVRLVEPNLLAPFPFNQAMECIATALEIETYSLKVAEVIDGVTWTRTIDTQKIQEAVRAVSTWKQAGRAYWGRWAQMQKLTCVSQDKTWTLPNRALNVPWAHTIVSRVKMRLWENSRKALHVFVDSLITPEQINSGDSIGDWRLEKTYRRGLIIRGPGQYGDIESEKFERMSGVGQGSQLRNNSLKGANEWMA